MGEVQGVHIGDVAQLVSRDVTPTRALDLQDVGSEPGEHLSARRARLDTGEVDHLDPGERQFIM